MFIAKTLFGRFEKKWVFIAVTCFKISLVHWCINLKTLRLVVTKELKNRNNITFILFGESISRFTEYVTRQSSRVLDCLKSLSMWTGTRYPIYYYLTRTTILIKALKALMFEIICLLYAPYIDPCHSRRFAVK